MTINHFLVVLAGMILIGASVFAQPRNIYDQYGFQIYPPLTKQRAIIIVVTKDSPKKINFKWFRADGSTLLDRDFNVTKGEKIIITPIEK